MKRETKRKILRLKLIFSLFWTLNYYKGIDKLTFADWLYKKRVTLKEATDIANIFYSKNNQYAKKLGILKER